MDVIVSELRSHIGVVESQLGGHVVHVHVVYLAAHRVAGGLAMKGLEILTHALVEGPDHIRVLIIWKVCSQSIFKKISIEK